MQTSTARATFGRRDANAGKAAGNGDGREARALSWRTFTTWNVHSIRAFAAYLVLLGLGSYAFVNVVSTPMSGEERSARRAAQAEEARRDAVAKAEQDKQETRAEQDRYCTKQQNLAFIVTQDTVRSRLRAPSSATFPWAFDIYSKHVGNCEFDIMAYVDAQNGFGAMLRMYYTAKVTHDPEGNTWRVTRLDMQGN